MARKFFGTDGVRGRANAEPITPATILRLAMAAGQRFRRGNHRHLVVIGKDTRLSGYMLEPALAAGFLSMGMDGNLVGPVTDPANWQAWPIAMVPLALLGLLLATRIWSAKPKPKEASG